MPLTSKGTPYVVSTDLVANYPTVSSDLADHIDDNLQYNAQDINAQTGSGANAYTFALADASLYKLVTATNAATATYTVPPQSAVTWANGAVLRILNQGAGVVTLAGGSGVTLNGSVLTLNQYQYAEIHRTASNTWTVIGIATPPGLVKVTDSAFSAQSTVSINNCFTSTYNTYRVLLAITGLSSDLTLSLRLRVSGSDNSTSNYYRQTMGGSGSTVAAGEASGQTSWDAGSIDGPNSDFRYVFSFDIFGPQAATRTLMNGVRARFASDGTGAVEAVYNAFQANTQFDGISILTSTGNITGTARVYGYRD